MASRERLGNRSVLLAPYPVRSARLHRERCDPVGDPPQWVLRMDWDRPHGVRDQMAQAYRPNRPPRELPNLRVCVAQPTVSGRGH